MQNLRDTYWELISLRTHFAPSLFKSNCALLVERRKQTCNWKATIIERNDHKHVEAASCRERIAGDTYFIPFDVVTSQYGTLQAIGKRTKEPQSEGDRGPNGEAIFLKRPFAFHWGPIHLKCPNENGTTCVGWSDMDKTEKKEKNK